ncbi:MAG: Ig-like domain-containing protein, partial [Armatimonadetes bacterium]|nr:Ig-like domain-containing protein [Candidatus Hippobium faecium]
ASVTVNVVPNEEATIDLKGDSYVLIGKSINLSAVITPETESQDISWSSSDWNVARVVSGVVTGKNPGTVTITATSIDNPELSGSKTVTVVKYIGEQPDPNAYDFITDAYVGEDWYIGPTTYFTFTWELICLTEPNAARIISSDGHNCHIHFDNPGEVAFFEEQDQVGRTSELIRVHPADEKPIVPEN